MSEPTDQSKLQFDFICLREELRDLDIRTEDTDKSVEKLREEVDEVAAVVGFIVIVASFCFVALIVAAFLFFLVVTR